MINPKDDLSIEYIRRTFDYCAETGRLTWADAPDMVGRKRAGRDAGTVMKRGHRRVQIGKNLYLVHRLVWAYVKGEWPEGYIDHMNKNPSDNRMENLRVVTHSENMRNRKLNKNSTSGAVGVSRACNGRWIAYINTDAGRTYLGRFDTMQAARQARMAAQAEHNYHANHGGML